MLGFLVTVLTYVDDPAVTDFHQALLRPCEVGAAGRLPRRPAAADAKACGEPVSPLRQPTEPEPPIHPPPLVNRSRDVQRVYGVQQPAVGRRCQLPRGTAPVHDVCSRPESPDLPELTPGQRLGSRVRRELDSDGVLEPPCAGRVRVRLGPVHPDG